MNAHFFKLNPDKTEIICFLLPSSKNMKLINGAFIENSCIRFSNSVKKLGFIIDKHSGMELQTNAIVSHCYKLLGEVRRNRYLICFVMKILKLLSIALLEVGWTIAIAFFMELTKKS